MLGADAAPVVLVHVPPESRIEIQCYREKI
jgi:hypothetical protein